MGLLSGKYLAGNLLCKHTSQVLSVDMVDMALQSCSNLRGDVRDAITIVACWEKILNRYLEFPRIVDKLLF